MCIKPKGQPFTYATPDTVVQAEDILLVAGEQQQVQRFAEFT